jgi:Ca-activated chloride channel family protein
MSQPRLRIWPALLFALGLEVLFAVLLALVWFGALREQAAFRFAKPMVLWGLTIGPVMLALFTIDLFRRKRAMRRFAEAGTLLRMVPGVSFGLSTARFIALRYGLAFVVLALAGPQFGTRIEEVKAEGVDVVVALDVSNSMLCEDLRPSRMEVAGRALAQLVDKLHGDRLGIVVFAGEAFVQLPLTADKSAAKLFLSSIGPDMVPTQGTAIGAAIDLAQNSFEKDKPGGKTIIVITDGENHEDDAEGAARKAAEAGILVHTIGMGTPQGGPLPIKQRGQMMGFRKDKQGNPVVSRLNEQMLQLIAAEGKGAYVRATEASTGITELVDELRQMDRSEIGTYRFAGHEDRFQIPLAIGCVLLVFALALPERGRVRSLVNLIPQAK